jgi:hypothetical protein
LTLLSVFALTSLTAKADFNVIAQPIDVIPGGVYTSASATTLIDISAIPDFTTGITSITDGFQTVSFSAELEKRTVPGSWGTWGSPDDTESATPPVLAIFGQGNVLTLSLSVPSTVFGFELEGNDFGSAEFRVTFYEGAVAVGSITETIVGDAGARLMAAYTTDSPFTSVMIDNVDGLADGYAIAQVRYNAVPEPASVIMIVQAIGAVGFYGWRKRRQIAQSV